MSRFAVILSLGAFLFGSFSFSSSAQAGPVITAVSGKAVNGQQLVISGTGFGPNVVAGTGDAEFVGGINDPLNKLAPGTPYRRVNWYVFPQSGEGDIRLSTNEAGFGNEKALETAGPPFPLSYKFVHPVREGERIFVSWWEKASWSGNGQYSILRLSQKPKADNAAPYQNDFTFHNNASGVTFGCPLQGTCALYPDFSPAAPQNMWTRVDVDMLASSSGSGFVTLTKYRPGAVLQSTRADKYTSQATGETLDWVVWENEFGDDGIGTMSAGEIKFANLFLQHGTVARVELCDAPIWFARQTCFIQPASSWGSSISVVLNDGLFPVGSTKYLYVVDANGKPSRAYPIVLGEAANAAPASASQVKVALELSEKGPSIEGAVTLTATTNGAMPLRNVEFRANGTLIGSAASSPYRCEWDTSSVLDGQYYLQAIAYDVMGKVVASERIGVSVANGASGAMNGGAVAIAAPNRGDVIKGSVAISAPATEGTKVALYANGALIARDVADPFVYRWNTTTVADGDYVLTAVAYNAKSLVAVSSEVRITVNNRAGSAGAK